MRFFIHSLNLVILSMALACASTAMARDAAFVEPTAAAGATDEALKIDPKADIDVGETTIGVVKHLTLFVVNQSAAIVKISSVDVTSDSNVTLDAGGNDCVKQGTLMPNTRCSIALAVTSLVPGPWSGDIQIKHDGAGRLIRAHLTGKTAGSTAEKKDSGLAMNAQETKPIDFGDVSVGENKAVRSTLMVNDSLQPITIYSIDVIAADNGLQRLDQGCAVDMELAPGASCPVTLLWKPKNSGPVSTDLIIRHSGHMGFVVIPVRGMAKGSDSAIASGEKMAPSRTTDIVPVPPTARELEQEMAGKIPPLSHADIGRKSSVTGRLYLIGTIGDRGLFLKPDNQTVVAAMGEMIEMGDGKMSKVIAVSDRSASVVTDGKRQDLKLETVPSLVEDAKAAKTTTGSVTGNAAPASPPPNPSGAK